MKLILVNKNSQISDFEGSKVLNLCINGSIERYFDLDLQNYCSVIELKKSNNFKINYLKKIDNVACNYFQKTKNNKDKCEVVSYRSFSKLAVSDNLIDKFWVAEQIEFFKTEDIVILIDDKDLFNYYQGKRKCIKISYILPYKQFYYFFLFLYNKIKSPFYSNIGSHSNFLLFIGNKFEIKRNINELYDEYFFSKYWRNNLNSLLLLNRGDWNCKVKKSDQIYFKETFISFVDLFDLLVTSLKHFYFPIQILEHDVEDYLLNLNLQIDTKTGSFIDSLSNYYIYNKIKKIIPNENIKIIVPHEGRVYEKIICIIFNTTENKLTGYAHFPVSERILNYYYGQFEEFIYKKFSFYTLSNSNFNYFVNVYNWPIDKVKIGAHLKHKPLSELCVLNKKFHILLLLGNELIQNIRLLKFIELGVKETKFSVLVRLHPSSRGVSIISHLINKFNFTKSTNNSLSEDVALCNLITYGDTGAAIDCLNYDLPLCYIKDDICLSSDRIHDTISGHFIFNLVSDFKKVTPLLINQEITFSFEKITSKYISPINPETFNFD